jgi:hypothetical protein
MPLQGPPDCTGSLVSGSQSESPLSGGSSAWSHSVAARVVRFVLRAVLSMQLGAGGKLPVRQ